MRAARRTTRASTARARDRRAPIDGILSPAEAGLGIPGTPWIPRLKRGGYALTAASPPAETSLMASVCRVRGNLVQFPGDECPPRCRLSVIGGTRAESGHPACSRRGVSPDGGGEGEHRCWLYPRRLGLKISELGRRRYPNSYVCVRSHRRARRPPGAGRMPALRPRVPPVIVARGPDTHFREAVLSPKVTDVRRLENDWPMPGAAHL
jgi:hypothetical protein